MYEEEESALSALGKDPQVFEVDAIGKVEFSRKTLTEGGPSWKTRQSHHAHQHFDSSHAHKHFDSSEQYIILRQPKEWGEARYIVGWKPVIAQHRCPDGSPTELMHHANLLGMSREAAKGFEAKGASFVGAPKEGPADQGTGPNLRLVASYDRGAAEYRLPHGYGIPIGPGTSSESLVMEYHLLLPPCWDFAEQPSVPDVSGFKLLVTKRRPRKLAALVGFFSEDMHVPMHKGTAAWSNVARAENLMRILCSKEEGCHGDDAEHQKLELLALHTHTHDIAKTKSFELRDKKGRVVFTPKEEKAGYGPHEQSFYNLADRGWPRVILEQGQQMSMRCTYDTDKFERPLLDGTSWGEEMCAALMVVGNYDSNNLRGTPGSVISNGNGYFNEFLRRLLWLASP